MIDRGARSANHKAGGSPAHQPGQRLLPSPSGAHRGPRNHATSRPAASGGPLRRFADVARPAGCRWEQGRPSACQNADAADGDIGTLSPCAHHQASSPANKIYPYLLRGMAITRPNQVWAMDITYIPMARGFVYLAVVLELVQPPRAVVARLDHDGSGILRRDAGGRSRSPRQARDLQHGSGLAVHGLGFHRCAQPPNNGIAIQHGR